MSQRDKDRKDSLATLGRIADAVSKPIVPPKPSPSAPLARPPAARPPGRPTAPPPKAAPPPSFPKPAYETDAERTRRLQMAERKAKLEEQRALKERRERELSRSKTLEWRGGGFTDIPASIRRTGFDRHEPSLQNKLSDVLGDLKEKESRIKNREKGRRQGGR